MIKTVNRKYSISNIASIIIFMLLITGTGISQPKLLKKVDTRIGMMNYAFGDLNIKDGSAAFSLWINAFKNSLYKRKVTDVIVKYDLFSTLDELEESLKKGNTEFITIKTVDYFKLKEPSKLVPFLTGSRSSATKFDQFLLVTSKKSGINNLSDIKGNEIQVANSFFTDLSKMWVKLLLYDSKKSNSKNSKIKSVSISESNLLLGVFFGKYNCAVISYSSYQLVCELNPQVKNSTNILATSPNLINSLFAYSKNADPDLVYTYRTISENLHNESEGKQILTLFKTAKVEHFSELELKATEKLIKRHNSIFKSIDD